VLLGWGLNIVVGLAGLLDLGYVAFLCHRRLHLRTPGQAVRPVVWMLLPLAGIFGRVLGRAAWLSGAAAARRLSRGGDARLRRDHSPGADQLEGRDPGQRGIGGLPRPTFFGLPFNASPMASRRGWDSSSRRCTARCFSIYVVLAVVRAHRDRHRTAAPLPVGRAWEALREDEIACRSLGINTTNAKLAAFASGASSAALQGPSSPRGKALSVRNR